MDTGVYQIRHLDTNRRYIGSTGRDSGFAQRWSEHKRELVGRRHKNPHLQRAWDRDGGDTLVFEVLEECESGRCLEREQFYLDTLLFANDQDDKFRQLGYNIRRIAESNLGIRFSRTTKQRMSISKSGCQNPSAKLDREQVLQIRALLDSGTKQKDIADRFGITQQMVSHIKMGRKWKNGLERKGTKRTILSSHQN